MEIIRLESYTTLPCPRGFTATMTIRSFKGRKDVLVHLFRPQRIQGEDQDYDWNQLIDVHEQGPVDAERGDTKEVILETFTQDELEQLVTYLSTRYKDRLVNLSTNVLHYPLPPGLIPFSTLPEGKDMGRIRFEIVPNYPLDFVIHGFYDLGQHKPVIQDISS